ncbi:MAG: DNA polymerase domain-containing protein, partial [Candidatus Heimdallarchaeota archaeon]
YIVQNDSEVHRWQRGMDEVSLRRYYWAGEDLTLYKLFGIDPRKIAPLSKEFKKMGLETYETDIPYLKRFLIDNSLKCLNVITAQVTNFQQEGNKILAEASYKDIYPVSSDAIPSVDLFYKMKVMTISVKTNQQEETMEQLMEKKDKRILSISVIWGTDTISKGGKLFLLQENSNDAEKRIIMDFLKFTQTVQPDILITYRGDAFDLPYLLSRMRKLNIPNQLLSHTQEDSVFFSSGLLCYRIKGRISFDLALRTWGIHPISGKKGLYDIAQEVLGWGTQGQNEENMYDSQELLSLTNLWETGMAGDEKALKSLVKHCFQDSKIVYDLYWRLGMTGWMETLRTTGFPTAEASSCTERLNGEFELMRFMRRKGILIPERPDAEQIEKNRLIREAQPHQGGTVLYPQGSLHTGVLIADFRSMYPSVMIAHNIGGETMKQWIEGSDVGDPKKLFHKQSRSCLAIMEETLIKKRIVKKKKIKELEEQLKMESSNGEREQINAMLKMLGREQNSMKIVANSMYGAHFYIRSRFYTQTLAAAIADSARTYLLGVKNAIEEISRKVTPCELVYGDTDSTFIKIIDENLFEKIYLETDPEIRKQLLSELMITVTKILKELNMNLPDPLELKFENLAYKVIFKPDRKKAYSYVSLIDDELKIKGFEAVRSDWSPLARTAQRKVLEILLKYPKTSRQIIETGKEREEFSIAKQFLANLGVKILQMSTEELLPKIVILSPIRRHPAQYKGKTPAVQAFLDYAKRERLDVNKEWMNYDKFPFVITTGNGLIYDRAKHPKYVDDIDREHYVVEMLRCCEDLGVKVSLEEVKSILPSGRLDLLFDEMRENGAEEQPIEEIILPVKKGDLQWRVKKSGKKKKASAQLVAGQSVLTLFADPNEKND